MDFIKFDQIVESTSAKKIREELLTRIFHDVRENVEKLLRQWVATGHNDHLGEVAMIADETTLDVETYQCQRDGAKLRLEHSMKIDDTMPSGTILRYTVTPIATWPVTTAAAIEA